MKKKSQIILSLLELIKTSFPTWGPKTKFQMDFYIASLINIDERILVDVIGEIMRENREFSPPLGVIISRCAEKSLGKIESNEEAWGIVSMNLRQYGIYDIQAGKDNLNGIIKATVEEIGYKRLCEHEKDYAERTFKKLYEKNVKTKINEAAKPNVNLLNGMLLIE